MTIVGLDDTDSRTRGMCTTYAATEVAAALRESGASVERMVLMRLNPAVEEKTRGNAALAIHTDAAPNVAFDAASGVIEQFAETADDRTNPGLVVAEEPIPESVATFSREAIREKHDLAAAEERIEAADYLSAGWKSGLGKIGALAAVGAHAVIQDWTYEHIAYREPDRWGTPRKVDEDSLFAAADRFYPEAWDTVDRGEGEAVCVPNAPGPILFGIRGDDREAVSALAEAVESEPVHRTAVFQTNQGTDMHLADATLDAVVDEHAYRVTGEVVEAPETGPGGHVFLTIGQDGSTLRCAAFEPTKRFRDRVRALRVGDTITAAGEVSDGTLKLEKFAVRDLVRTELVTPTCPDCGRRMESAGAGQGYRCRDCGTAAESKAETTVDRDLETGWYEVPPCARRHIARPLVRGGFDAPVHPER